MFGCPPVDLFAIRANALHLYVPPVLDHMALKQDAFQHPCSDLSAYAFPPFVLLSSKVGLAKSDVFDKSLLVQIAEFFLYLQRVFKL